MLKAIRLTATCIALAIPSFAAPALAAPECNAVPYGNKCMRCAGWANMSTWAPIACSLNANPTAPGFACNSMTAKIKCGVVIKKETDMIKNKKL